MHLHVHWKSFMYGKPVLKPVPMPMPMPMLLGPAAACSFSMERGLHARAQSNCIGTAQSRMRLQWSAIHFMLVSWVFLGRHDAFAVMILLVPCQSRIKKMHANA